ncbi:MAG: glutaredoxin [Methylococcales symbiont of Iophon sp. n. MRB-2018]|nr:MAG: glutaredoxin [Methylococcales symbiont of Iophon sp. n. MRB-2018]KAF3979954.1 MAG: glutaredoxin [Methylococcales symbiont of Iophon sp. n. MRB-2018]
MKIVIYSTNTCSICVKAKELLNKLNLPFEQKMIDEDRGLMAEFSKVTNGARMVPQIVIDDKHIGGFSDLTELHTDGFFD